MDDDSLDQLFSGDLRNLVALPKRVVRLFVSSTFTDMTLERNSLMERVYPRLKRYCRERHGLDFQVVDMRWGVRDEATDDHRTVELCSREIANCQRISLGPNFVALIGDKYGFRPLPSRIRSTEYRAVRRSLIELDFNTDFLDTWYREDLNAVPAEYVLQPISSILKNFTNRSEPELQAVDQRIWQACHERLHELLRRGSARLVEQGRMDEGEQLMRYSISVTEREVIEGCLKLADARRRCLVYSRSLLGLDEAAGRCLEQLASGAQAPPSDCLQAPSRRDSVLRKASLKIGSDTISLATCAAQSAAERRLERARRLVGRYTDLVVRDNCWQVDAEARAALAQLKGPKLARKFGAQATNLSRLEVAWDELAGLSLRCEQHQRYLSRLNEHFYASLCRMVRAAVRHEQAELATGGLVGELLQHSHYARRLARDVQGRGRELAQLRAYVEAGAAQQLPMFVYGVGGAGKTCVLARFAALAAGWATRGRPVRDSDWRRRPCVVMRFCCTTPSSSSLLGVLTSVCRQLQFNFYQFGGLAAARDGGPRGAAPQLAYQALPTDLVRLVFVFRQLLDNCRHPLHRRRLFVIVLDSVERLACAPTSSLEERCAWLTGVVGLPPNVRLIVSCSSEPTSARPLQDLFRHLKRHFLLAHRRQARAGPGGAAQAAAAGRPGRRWLALRRLLVPAVRLLRGRAATGGAPPGRWPALGMLHVRPLGRARARATLSRWLADLGRRLSAQQWALVEDSLARCSRPIFAKLTLGEVAQWRSYSAGCDPSGGLGFGSGARPRPGAPARHSRPGRALAALAPRVAPAGLELQLLLVEQQWLRFAERRQQLETRSVESRRDDGHQQTLVVRLGAQLAGRASGAPGAAGAGPAAAGACRLSESIDEAISQLLGRIELQHGHLLTKHSLAYITAARCGLGENELEDILSLDDVVLDDVFQYHLPPIRRIPPLLWTRIRSDLPGYLSERDADGIVLDWHHGQFRRVARRRYLAEAGQSLYIHSTMADYFLGRWADKPKPFKCTRRQIQMAAEQLDMSVQSSLRDSQSPGRAGAASELRIPSMRPAGVRGSSLRPGASVSVRNRLRSSDQHEARFQWLQAQADRRVPQQPLYYVGASDSPSSPPGRRPSAEASRLAPPPSGPSSRQRRRYNLRKLTELPYHLMRARRFRDLATNVLFNYRWLHAAIDALGLQSLFADFEEALVCLETALAEAQPLAASDGAHADRPAAGEQPVASDTELAGLMLGQLVVLLSTLRLSSSAIHLDKQMLAPQLIGRLMPMVRQQRHPLGPPRSANTNFDFLAQLIDQCDQVGCLDCALLPLDHCLQSADGLQLSSLEGHSFAVMSMAVSSDQRHLLAASNKFILWDIATGEVARTIDPGLSGSIIRQLRMGSSGELVVAFTSDNFVLALDIPTQQFAKYDAAKHHHLEASDAIIGLDLIDAAKASRFLVWTRKSWMVFSVDSCELSWSSSKQDERENAHDSAIRLEYSMDLMEEINIVGQLVSLSMDSAAPGQPCVDLAFAIVQKQHSDQLQLVTIELILDPDERSCQSVYVWPARIECSSIILANSSRQLIYSTSNGNVHLARRRDSTWSRPKLIRSPPAQMTASRPSDANNPSQLLQNTIESHLGSSPLAIDVGCSQMLKESSRGLQNVTNFLDESSLSELVAFEQSVDLATKVEDENEIEEQRVFVDELQLVEQSPGRKRLFKPILESISHVKLYFIDRIVVLDLVKRPRVERCLKLPLDIRCVKLEPNRCQLASVIMQTASGEHNLIVAANKQLLVYSLEGEQLLSCIDAHVGRITELKPIILRPELRPSATSATTSSQQQLTRGLNSRMEQSVSLATCSMDTSVKIWNLANINERSQSIDTLNQPIASVCLSPKEQFPFAACVARSELAIWNWQTLALISGISLSDLVDSRPKRDCIEPVANGSKPELKRIIKCKWSRSGHQLVVATTQSIHLMSNCSAKEANQGDSRNRDSVCSLKKIKDLWLNSGEVLHKIKLICSDSRLIIILANQASEHDTNHSTENANARAIRPPNESENNTGQFVIRCYSLPEFDQLYSIKSPMYHVQQATGDRTIGLEQPARQQQSAGMATRQQLAQRKPKMVQLPVITCDQQLIVVVCSETNGYQLASLQEVGQHRIRGSILRQDGLQTLEKSASRPGDGSISRLNIYSTRDGSFVRSISLDRIHLHDPTAQQQRRSISSKTPTGKLYPRQPLDHSQRNDTGEKRQSRAGVRFDDETGTMMQISIRGDQFTRLKAVRYLDRQSIVGLIDETGRGPSFLLDTSSGQLIGRSNSWNGRVSTDGRYGLTWILKSASSLPVALEPSDSLQTIPDSLPGESGPLKPQTADLQPQPSSGSSGGLQLLEMRHCRPTKLLLNLDELKLAGRGESQAGQSGCKMTTCGFTKPNDQFVYYHDARLKRLLLIRVSDCKLVANYRLQAAATCIRCSSDGWALICGLADGSLVSFAIVDPKTSDTLARLAQYPSRRKS